MLATRSTARHAHAGRSSCQIRSTRAATAMGRGDYAARASLRRAGPRSAAAGGAVALRRARVGRLAGGLLRGLLGRLLRRLLRRLLGRLRVALLRVRGRLGRRTHAGAHGPALALRRRLGLALLLLLLSQPIEVERLPAFVDVEEARLPFVRE